MSTKKLFVVEDDPGIQCIVEYILSNDNFSVFICSTVKKFKELSLIDTPDLIILDVMLPDGNGVTLCTELKSSVATKNIPVLMMSANVSEAELMRCQPDMFIAKPFDIHDFSSKVHELIQHRNLSP